jgi:phosphate transport system permease protein
MNGTDKKDLQLTRTHAAPGEPFVWLTAMGLSLGLLMVVGLLGIIVSNGLPVFWPSKIVEIQLKPGVKNPVPNGGQTITGEIVQTREKRIPILGADGAKIEDQTEVQIFVGNKDVNGSGFAFINNADIASMSEPRDIYRVERMEYGIAFGYPRSLQLADGASIPATSPDFSPTLARLESESATRRHEIEKIEKHDIGLINSRITELRAKGKGSPESLQQIATLDADYQILAAKARELRAKQSTSALIYDTPNGVERRLPIGDLVAYTLPNTLDTTQKLGLFVHNFWNFLTLQPREANTEGGIFPAIFGTFVMTLLMSLGVVPFGVVAAIYLREYARQGFAVRAVRIAVNNLAGVPSIVFGVFGLGFFVYFVGASVDSAFFGEYLPTPTFGTGGILWAAATLALMTVPVVIVATEEALAAVPRGMREGSLSCGASKWQTIQRIILPASLPGILTGLILAMARGAGEVAPLMLVGVVKLAPSLPIDGDFPFVHLERKFMHLGFHIYDLGFQSPDSEAAKPMVFATTLLLILLVVVLNLAAILIREKLRKRYATGAF